MVVGDNAARRGARTRGWWLLACPLVVGILGAIAFFAGSSSTYLDAQVLGTSISRTDRLAASAGSSTTVGASSTTATDSSNDSSTGDSTGNPSGALSSPIEDPIASTSVPDVAAPAVSAPPATAVTAPPVTAAPPTGPSGQPAVAASVDLPTQVLARISYPWQTKLPGWRIEFVGARPGYRGSTFPNDRVMQIYVRPDESLDELVHVTAHELGHAVDVTYLDQAERSSFNLKRGRPADSSWWVANGADDFSSGAGDWAECFAWSQMQSGPWYSRLGNPPDASTLGLVEALAG